MLQPRILSLSRPSLGAILASGHASSCLRLLNQQPRPCSPAAAASPPYTPPTAFTRQASHAAQGRANGPTDSAGRRLGAKRGASEYVTPGTIIFRQRGTKWFPGENVGMGRDHTIYALQPGWVRYYRDPERDRREGRASRAARGDGRRYIGVALVKDGPQSVLPRPLNAASVRRLGMYAQPIATEAAATPTTTATTGKNVMSARELGQWEPMAELVQRAEQHQVRVRPFDRRDRWYAWRVRSKKIAARRMLRAATGGKKKAKAKAARPKARK